MPTLITAQTLKPPTYPLYRGGSYALDGVQYLKKSIHLDTKGEQSAALPTLRVTAKDRTGAFVVYRGVLLKVGAAGVTMANQGVLVRLSGGSAEIAGVSLADGQLVDAQEWDTLTVRNCRTNDRIKRYFVYGGSFTATLIKGSRRLVQLIDNVVRHASRDEALVRGMFGHWLIEGGEYDNREQRSTPTLFKHCWQLRGDNWRVRGTKAKPVFCGGSFEVGQLTKSSTQDHLRKGLRTVCHMSDVQCVGFGHIKPGATVALERVEFVDRDLRGGGDVAVSMDNFAHIDRPRPVVMLRNCQVKDARRLAGQGVLIDSDVDSKLWDQTAAAAAKAIGA